MRRVAIVPQELSASAQWGWRLAKKNIDELTGTRTLEMISLIWICQATFAAMIRLLWHFIVPLG